MTRRKALAVAGVTIGVALVCLCPVEESTYEFDAVNFRLRACKRARALAFGFVLWERCGPVADHPTAARLRELGVVGPVKKTRTRWVLIKGFKPGVRGWHGDGKRCLRALGETSFGTPVPLPANEQLDRNAWVRWALHDPAASRRFWARVQNAPADDWHYVVLLEAARGRLERNPFPADDAELETHARSMLGLDQPVTRPSPATAAADPARGARCGRVPPR